MTEAAWQQRTMLTTTIFEAEVDLETSLMFRSACIAAVLYATCKLQESDRQSSTGDPNMCQVFLLSSTNLHAAAIHFRLQLDEGSGVVAAAACLRVSLS